VNAKFADAFNNRGTAYAKKGDFDKAIADYDAAIRIDPKIPSTYGNRGLALVKAGQFARAVADFDQALAGNPKDALSLYNRGVAKQKMGNNVGGDIDVINARGIDPNVGR
jgi:tetratricopeptide (TPR) repeat protein